MIFVIKPMRYWPSSAEWIDIPAAGDDFLVGDLVFLPSLQEKYAFPVFRITQVLWFGGRKRYWVQKWRHMSMNSQQLQKRVVNSES